VTPRACALAVLLVAWGCAAAGAPSPRSPASRSSPKTVRALVFRGERFTLRAKSAENGLVLNEYLPVGQQLTTWTRLLAVQQLPGLTDKSAALHGLVTLLQQQHPDAPIKIWRNDATGDLGIDFVTRNGEQFAEFSVFVYVDSPDGEGLVARQYAERAYGDAIAAYLKDLEERRRKLVADVLAYEFPPVVQ
jgi:hypothetical protein